MADFAIHAQGQLPEGTLLALALIDGRILSNMRRAIPDEGLGPDVSMTKRHCGTSDASYKISQVQELAQQPLAQVMV